MIVMCRAPRVENASFRFATTYLILSATIGIDGRRESDMTVQPPDHLRLLLKPGVDHAAEADRCRRLAASISEGPTHGALLRLAADHSACQLYLERAGRR